MQINRPVANLTKLALNNALRTYVEERLGRVVVTPSSRSRLSAEEPTPWPAQGSTMERSPEPIARRLPIDFPDDKTMRISHEAIYQAPLRSGP